MYFVVIHLVVLEMKQTEGWLDGRMDTYTTSSIMHPSYACHTNNTGHHNSFYNLIALRSEK